MRNTSRWQWLPSAVAYFFKSTLLLWLLSLLYIIAGEGRRDLWPVLAGCVFYEAANLTLKVCSLKDPNFVNIAVSLLHSTVTSTSVMVVLLCEWMDKGAGKMFDHKELFSGIWSGAFKALCFSCGYFAYDQWDMLDNHLYNPWAPSILVHHALLLICFTLALYRHVTINYLILTLVCELHSIFLHLRRVLRMLGLRTEKNLRTKIEWGLHWLAFFSARVFVHWFITYKLIKDSSKFPHGIELPLAFLGMVGMNVLNYFLGIDLVKACQKELIKSS
uniref:TLC domain-containing protein n=1 Tax=Araucaria cunninghamii TaxID=56994 RepID=A0A0D6R7I1_ARACU